jgi:GDP-D-mannose dehydratase
MSSKRALITGITGRDGSYLGFHELIREMLDEDCRAVGIERAKEQGPERLAGGDSRLECVQLSVEIHIDANEHCD